MKLLITGFSGFVSRHFIDYLEANKIECEILGVDLIVPEYDYSKYIFTTVKFEMLNLLDSASIEKIVGSFKPEYVLHLASYSSVGFSWNNPALSFRNNMDIFLNLMEVVRQTVPECRVLSVGSSEEYGNIEESMLPLKEEYTLNPVSPYAVARVSQEQLSKVYCDGFGLDIVMTRSFNHIGAGQKDIFVISSFARQLVEIKKGIKKDKRLVTGDITVIRDFLDVRDVVEAYYMIFSRGEKGEVYNICSGRGISLREVIEIMSGILGIEVELETAPNLVRPNDNRVIVGSNSKLKTATGWYQKIDFKKSLEDIIDYWEKSLTPTL